MLVLVHAGQNELVPLVKRKDQETMGSCHLTPHLLSHPSLTIFKSHGSDPILKVNSHTRELNWKSRYQTRYHQIWYLASSNTNTWLIPKLRHDTQCPALGQTPCLRSSFKHYYYIIFRLNPGLLIQISHFEFKPHILRKVACQCCLSHRDLPN